MDFGISSSDMRGATHMDGTGSNQWGGGWPSLGQNMFTPPGSQFGTSGGYLSGFPSTTNYGTPTSYGQYGFFPNPTGGPQGPTSVPALEPAGQGYFTGSSYDPSLTADLFGFLQSQVGQQLPAYPGQLTAPPNDVLNSLQQFLTTGQGGTPGLQQLLGFTQGQGLGQGTLQQLASGQGPGMDVLNQIAQTGDPTDVGPAWNAMLAAQQQNIQQNQAQLKEQMSAGGNLVGSPYGNVMANYQEQTAKDQNALLAQMQQAAQEAAAGRKLTAAGEIPGIASSAAGTLGGQGLGAADFLGGLGLPTGMSLQGINQQALQSQYQEWLRQQPQNNPLLSYMYGAGTTFPPYLYPGASSSPWGGLAQGLGSVVQAIQQQLGKDSGSQFNFNPSFGINLPSGGGGGGGIDIGPPPDWFGGGDFGGDWFGGGGGAGFGGFGGIPGLQIP